MANLLITTACNASCPFCFARSFTGQQPAATMTMARYLELLTLIRSSGGSEVRFAGGEPTLHPDFAAMITAAVEQELRITVLSNGLLPEAALVSLEQHRCSVLLNSRAEQPQEQQDRASEVLRRLGSKVVLGWTIDQIPADIEPVLTLLNDRRWQPAPFLRVGMAHPVLPSLGNRHLHAKDYPAVGRLLGQLAQALTRISVRLVLDCGFVRCQLDDETVLALEENQAQTRFECRPIVDLGPGDQAVHCLATASRLKIRADGSLQSVREALAGQRRAFEQLGVYRECSDCAWRIAGHCDGGCLVHRLARLQPVVPRLIPEEVLR